MVVVVAGIVVVVVGGATVDGATVVVVVVVVAACVVVGRDVVATVVGRSVGGELATDVVAHAVSSMAAKARRGARRVRIGGINLARVVRGSGCCVQTRERHSPLRRCGCPPPVIGVPTTLAVMALRGTALGPALLNDSATFS